MSPKAFVDFPAPSSVADRIGLAGPRVSSGGTGPPTSPASGGTAGGRCPRGMSTSCGMLVTLLLLMKAGVTLASVTTERTNQLPGHPTNSPHHHHHHHLGHGRHGPEPHPGTGHAAAPTHNRHRLRHSGGNDVPCSKCPPGWGVIARCHPRGRGDNADAQWDTACAPCPKGFHSPHNSATAKCLLCSRCGPGLFESHPCTPKSDTVCDSCLTARPRPLGADFDRKCLFGRSSGYFRWLSEDDDGGGEEGEDGTTTKRVQRMTSVTAAAFRLSGQMRPRGEGGGEEVGDEEEGEGGKVQPRGGSGERNETTEAEEGEAEGENGRSAGITWGVVSIAAFQFSVFAAAAVAVCHYLRKMHSCLAEDRERTAQEINPLMEVTPSH